MIQAQIKNTIENQGLIAKGDKVLLCVSGGPDSMTLLHLMVNLKNDYKIKLIVAHLDHMLRGRQSVADANFVKKTAAKLNIPFITERSDVKALADSNRASVEEAAREARYNFYQRAAERVGAKKIATGHTMDDQAETVLMRLIKGSGSRGLSGIPYKRRLGNMWVIRPLLDIRRVDIEKYLKRHKLPAKIDASNYKTFYLRNKIRHILIPRLEKEFNPKIKENLNLIAKNLSVEFNYLNTTALRLFKRLTQETKTEIGINVKDLLRRHVALQRLLVRQIIYKLKGNLKKITYKHWREIESMLSDEKKRAVNLPNGIKVLKTKDRLVFVKGGITQKRTKKLKEVAKLAIPGEISIPELGIKVSSEIVRYIPKFKKGKRRKKVEYINGDSIIFPLKIRTRRKGDRIKPLGMRSYKKLHDIFVDEKVPREVRDGIPIIISGNEILWAAGVKLSEDCKIDKNTKRVVKLTVNRVIKK